MKVFNGNVRAVKESENLDVFIGIKQSLFTVAVRRDNNGFILCALAGQRDVALIFAAVSE